MTVRVEPVTGPALSALIGELAELRVRIFSGFPYLYDGSAEYEAQYLRAYQESPGAIVVAAFDGARLVGAATGTPMLDHHGEFAEAFEGQPYRLDEMFYCAESVLLEDYRGQGLGHRFFDVREEHARSLGARWSCFCAVIRDPGHPAKPKGYKPLDPFWRKRGYRPLEGVVARFSWKEHDEAGDTPKEMQFWLKELEAR